MFDLHGVIETYPVIFKPFMESLKLAGHKIFICSGPVPKKIRKELDDLGYIKGQHYDYMISVVDYLIGEGHKILYDENGDPWVDDKLWWSTKGDIAKLAHIDIVIDDRLEYKGNMPPGILFLQVR